MRPPLVSRHMYRARGLATAAAQSQGKKEGDISSVFVSLSGAKAQALPERFRQLKQSLIAGHEDAVVASWGRLLSRLQVETQVVVGKGPAIIPSVEFKNLQSDLDRLSAEIKLRGAAVVRGVIDEQEARSYKEEVEEYVRKNPHTKAFPANNPQVFELYWSAPQLKARSHPNLLATQSALMQKLWHFSPGDPISLEPLSYADRLRIRQPGDATFALGPHIDGGGVERWERRGYGVGGVYDSVFRGAWESYDPWNAGPRIRAVTDLYNGSGACSMFRMFQGWLSMSHSGPRHGTLLVNPMLQLSMAYLLLRPFFALRRDGAGPGFLDADNWVFTAGESMTSELQGASPGHAQELNDALHPHLQLERTMVHMPEIKPGDYVVWHCDQIHSVDKVHEGTSDSSVMYIPVCPITEQNLEYLKHQREAFLAGTPGPDFPGGKGESDHIGRPSAEFLSPNDEGRRAMGLEPLQNVSVIGQANAVLEF
ncbi:hypothetical protein BROUX41_002152 [Berkeleyomyces rouxiae]